MLAAGSVCHELSSISLSKQDAQYVNVLDMTSFFITDSFLRRRLKGGKKKKRHVDLLKTRDDKRQIGGSCLCFVFLRWSAQLL